jgi:hypothetical protein
LEEISITYRHGLQQRQWAGNDIRFSIIFRQRDPNSDPYDDVVKAVQDERRVRDILPPENPPIASASASTGRPGIPSGRARFVQNEDGQWVRLAKTEIVPAHAIQIKSLKEQEELLWRKVGKVDQHIEEIEQIKDIGDIPVEIEETMKELQRERIHLEYEIKTINSHLVHRVKDLLEKYGIKSSLVKSDGMESLLINLKTDHPIHETVRKYLSRVTDEPLGYFSYEYNPFKLRQMMAGGAILNGNNFVMGMHTIERLVTNNLDSLEFHEIRHLFHAIRRKNQIPSIWDQRFRSTTDDLIEISKPMQKTTASRSLTRMPMNSNEHPENCIGPPKRHLEMSQGCKKVLQLLGKSSIYASSIF